MCEHRFTRLYRERPRKNNAHQEHSSCEEGPSGTLPIYVMDGILPSGDNLLLDILPVRFSSCIDILWRLNTIKVALDWIGY